MNRAAEYRAVGISWAVLLLSLLLAAPLSAQSGILFVQVNGPTGPLSGARVEVLLRGGIVAWGDADVDGRARIGGIPEGTFSVRVQAMGYREQVREGVRVVPGTIQTLEFTLETAPFELEALTVRAERVQVQRESTEFSTQVDQGAIELLPVSFTATDLVALTPGARPGHIWGGASFQANSYRLDGLSANHPGLGGDLLQPSIYWIDRLEVRGLGAGAEYGGFQGGLVDVVTKSGTNDFQGTLRSTFEDDGLNGTNLVSTEIGREVTSRQDLEGEVRGPLIRDRLFYFLSGKYVNQDQKALNHLDQFEQRYAPISEERGEEKLFGKLTWTPGPAHQLEVSGAFTNTHADNFGITGFEAAGATHTYSSPTWFLNASARKILGTWGGVEARVNHFSRNERYDPYNGKDVPGLSNYVLTPPFNAFQNAPYTLRSAPTSTSATLVGTFRARTGEREHALKVGAELTRGSFLDRRIRNGGLTWLPVRWTGFDPANPYTWTQPATPSLQIASHWGGEVHLDADVLNAAAFAQGTVSVGPRVVLTPGLRFNHWRGWLTPKDGDRFQAVQDEGLDPRIGLSVELNQEGTLVAKAHWGRYHQNMISQMFDRVEGGNVFTNEEFWYYQGPTFTDPTTTYTESEREALAQSWQFTKQGEVILNEMGPAVDYTQPYVDQWLIGLEKQVGNWMKIEALFTHRSNHDMVALVDQNRASNYTAFQGVLVVNDAGELIPYSGGTVVYFPTLWMPNDLIRARLVWLAHNPPDDNMIPVPGFVYADTLRLTFDPDYILTTAPNGKREFNQVQLNVEVERPTWGGNFSFAWTDLEGNLDNVSGYEDPTGYGAGPYVRVNEYTNAYGTLENFAEVEVKTSIWGNLPWRLRGGIYWNMRSGDHFSPRFRLYGLGSFRYFLGPEEVSEDADVTDGEELDFRLISSMEGHHVFVGPRGGHRVDFQSLLDLHLERTFEVQSQSLAVSLDIFNLWASRAITRVNTLVNNGLYYGTEQRPSIFGPAIHPSQYYQAVQERVRPRTVRLGAAWYF